MNMSKRAAARQLRALLIQLFPAAFPAEDTAIEPLPIGIHQTLHERLIQLGYSVDPGIIQQVLAGQTGRVEYLEALVKGDRRIDLDGNPAGPVDELAKVSAARKLDAMRQRQEEKAKRRQQWEAATAARQEERARRLAETQANPQAAENASQQGVLTPRRRAAKPGKPTVAPPPERPKVHIHYAVPAQPKRVPKKYQGQKTLTLKKPSD